jgi:DNA-binding GntR family transcriptional regulator
MLFENPATPATALAPVGSSTSRSDLVAQSIRTAILSGQLPPDQLLVERRLAEMLGVSKTPVREALIALSSSGLVTLVRNRGVVVRSLTLQEARDVFEERLLLEPWAVAKAIEGGADFAEANRLSAQASALAEGSARPALAMINREFHRALYSACENRLVVAALDQLQDMTALATLNVVWDLGPTWKPENKEHTGILRAARAADPDKAEQLMKRHIERSLGRLKAKGA